MDTFLTIEPGARVVVAASFNKLVGGLCLVRATRKLARNADRFRIDEVRSWSDVEPRTQPKNWIGECCRHSDASRQLGIWTIMSTCDALGVPSRLAGAYLNSRTAESSRLSTRGGPAPPATAAS